MYWSKRCAHETLNRFNKSEVKKMITFAQIIFPSCWLTLKTFMDRIDKNHGAARITSHDVVTYIQRTERFFPNACPYTLQVLADLLRTHANPKSDETLYYRWASLLQNTPNNLPASP